MKSEIGNLLQLVKIRVLKRLRILKQLGIDPITLPKRLDKKN